MRNKVYCAFCRVPQKVYAHKHVPLVALLAHGLVAAILSYVVWGAFHWSALLLFMSLSLITELLFQLKWRQSVVCRACGFDPVVYKRNPEQAAQEVKAFLAQRKEDPMYMLKPQPDLPKPRKKSSDESPQV